VNWTRLLHAVDPAARPSRLDCHEPWHCPDDRLGVQLLHPRRSGRAHGFQTSACRQSGCSARFPWRWWFRPWSGHGRGADRRLWRARRADAVEPVFAAGLGLLAVAPSPLVLFAGWAVIGLGMGIGLYEAAFATLAGIYGKEARGPITGITLIAGFASTVGWPLSGLMLATWGWREACIGWALIHLVVALPLNAWLPKRHQDSHCRGDSGRGGTAAFPLALWLLAFVFAATWFNSTAMAAHLPGLLASGRGQHGCSHRRRRADRPGAGRGASAGVRAVAPVPSPCIGPAGRGGASGGGGRAGGFWRSCGLCLHASAWGGQRDPDHRQGNTAARSLWTSGIRASDGMAQRACPHLAGGRPADLWRCPDSMGPCTPSG
jgi:hypothetical protein